MKLYKVLDKAGKPCHGGKGRWSLPTRSGDGWTPGEWMPEIEGPLEPCVSGYHLCRPQDLVYWFGPAIYRAEGDETLDYIERDDKIVWRRARLLWPCEAWNERTARLFACDCAEHVLHLYEAQRPDDARPRECIAMARRYASGEAAIEKLSAVRAAAGAAAWTAGAATGAAAWAAWAAADAAWDAGVAEAAGAAEAAADAAGAAEAAERAWQTERLMALLGEE